jgi:multidrug efflux pump subunit AcrB
MIISEQGLVPDWSAAYTLNAGTQDSTVKIQLSEHRKKSAQQYASLLRKKVAADPRFADLRINFDTGGMVSAALNNGASSPIDIQVLGGNLTQGAGLAQKVRERVARVAGAADVRVLQRLDAQQRVVEIDRKKAADFGLDTSGLIKQVATAMNSSVSISKNFWIDYKSGNQYFVAVQYPEDPYRKLEDVLNIPATGTNTSHPVKLGTLVNIKPATAAVEVNHVDLARVFNVMVNTDGKDIGSVANKINKALRKLQAELWAERKQPAAKDSGGGAVVFPDGMRIRVKGEYARMQESFGNLGFGLVLASVLIYMLLVVLFRSYLGPLVVMFAVPLGLIGVLAMLFLTRTTLNVQSAMGVIFMVGIVVANSVLLVDFANKQRGLGLAIPEAIRVAALTRFKPILMTFLATFLDLLPMALGGRGAEANAPLARAVIGGLISSTFLTLIVVPIMYTLLLRESAGDQDKAIEEELARSTLGTLEGAH